MKPIKYDRHARRRMEERGVTEEEIEITIKEAGHLKASIKGRQNAYRFIGERFLRVTFKEEVKHFSVITVTVKRGPFKE